MWKLYLSKWIQFSHIYNNYNIILRSINNTHAELVSSKTTFISQLKKYLIDIPFYSLDEFLELQTTDKVAWCVGLT